MYAVPNGGGRGRADAGRLRAEGVRPGVPDIVVPASRRGFTHLYLEFKREGSGRVSQAQGEWLVGLAELGACTAVVWSTEDAIERTCAYLDGAYVQAETPCPLGWHGPTVSDAA